MQTYTVIRGLELRGINIEITKTPTGPFWGTFKLILTSVEIDGEKP